MTHPPPPSPSPLIPRRVAFVAATAGLLPMLNAGVVTLRPNRLVSGDPLPLWQAFGWEWAGVCLGAGVVLVLAATRIFPRFLRAPVLGGVPLLLLLTLLLLAGDFASQTAAQAGPVARVSLGTVFWVWLFVAPVLAADTFQRAARRNLRALLIVAAVGGGALAVFAFSAGWLDHLSILREYANRQDRFLGELRTHLGLSGAAVGLACLIGIPVGYWAHRTRRVAVPSFFFLNTLQTLPSLALFAILIPLLSGLVAAAPWLGGLGVRGIGTAPALVALTLYSILPVARNTHAGFETVDPALRDAGRGMGMTRSQLLWQVELPVASPILLNGLRVALVQVLGLTAVAALIGAGGFGVFIFQGLGQAANDLILLGAIPTVLAAVVADTAMQALIAAVRPRGLR